MLSIQSNIASLDAQRNLDNTQNTLNMSLQQLSSGYRINTAADDAAGLAVSNNLESQVNGLNQATQNANDGIDMVQTAEGGLTQTTNILQTMRTLAVEASNGTLSTSDVGAINTELQQLQSEANAIAGQTQYNGISLLSGSAETTQSGGTTAAGDQFNTTGGNLAISSVNVSQAQASVTYTLSSAAAGTLTLTNGTTAVAQTINVAAIAAASANPVESLDFSQLGVNINVSSDAGGKTAAGMVTDLTGKTVITAAGSSSINLQVGANASDFTSVAIGNASISTSNSDTGLSGLATALSTFNTDATAATPVSATLTSDAQALITAVDGALNSVNSQNANLGAFQNRLQDTVANAQTTSENLASSESDIKDTNVAQATAEMTQANIQMQAGISVLAQANQIPQLALKLLS